MSIHVYRKGLNTGPAMRLAWKDYAGNLYDFSSGWTFSAKVVAVGANAALLTKTSGITGASTSPNVVVDWETADFTPLTASADYSVILTATPTSGDPITFERLPQFKLLPGPT